MDLFQPDTLLSEQFYGRSRQRLEPEQQLMLAVLEDAVICFQKYFGAKDERSRKLFEEAEEWISDSYSNLLFSFTNICEVLGLDPGYIQKGTAKWKERIEKPRLKYIYSGRS